MDDKPFRFARLLRARIENQKATKQRTAGFCAEVRKSSRRFANLQHTRHQQPWIAQSLRTSTDPQRISEGAPHRRFRNDCVCIVRSKHPAVGEKLTLKTYQAASHAVVSPDGREHLLEQHLQRRVAVGLSHFMSLLPIVESSDLVATLPRDLANICARHFGG